ncbi:MAG TPA: DegT/DnrJ/EryC1/StrS family aminotransferase [Acidimicrobiia bacterium]|nr:DegT/DnrJ/EryC1/StrS family aminotransferase [Acidimicrobiia bacterium]
MSGYSTLRAPRFDVPLVNLRATHETLFRELRTAFERVVGHASFVGGEEVHSFERELAAYVGSPHAVGLGSGTAALYLTFVAAGIGAGDEVILPPNTFFATVEAVIAAGATPVFVDVNPNTALLDPAAAECAVGWRTAAVVPVHLYGQPVAMEQYERMAARRGLFLVDDAAQALTATRNGRSVGSFGDATAFSFHPNKNLGALGEAGAVTTPDTGLADRIRLLRSHGEVRKNVHLRVGVNERLDALQAAFLSVKLHHLDCMQQARLQAEQRYRQRLAHVDGVRPLERDLGGQSACHLMVVRVARRDAVLRRLHEAGIEAGVHYPTPIHLQPACHEFGGRPGQLPEAEQLANSVLSLPLFPEITEAQIERTVECLEAAIEVTQ